MIHTVLKGCKLSLLLILFPYYATSQSFQLPWSYHDIFNSVNQSGANPDFYIEDSGDIHITFWNGHEDLLYYMSNTPGQEWTLSKVDSSHLNGFRSSIEPNPDGRPSVVYYQNNLGETELMYASQNIQGDFDTEILPAPPMGWGLYNEFTGFGSFLNIRSRPDLVFDPTGYPYITNFGGWVDYSDDGFSFCLEFFDNYDLSLWPITKISGAWNLIYPPNVPDLYYWCNSSPMPNGDRFGEFASVHTDIIGKKYITTHSFYNSHLLLFKSDITGTNFDVITLDTAESLVPNVAPFRESFTYDGISSQLTDQGSLHLTYATNADYGSGILPQLNYYNHLKYLRIGSNDSVYSYSFELGSPINPVCGYTDLEVIGDSEIFFTYADRSQDLVILKQSSDSGQTWQTDTLMNTFLATKAPLEIHNDSLFVLIYDGLKDQLWLYAKHKDDTVFNWRVEQLTQTEEIGNVMDSKTVIVSGDTVSYAAFTDATNGKLYFAEGKSSSGFVFVSEEVDSISEGVQNIKIRGLQDFTPVLIYTNGNGNLIMAQKQLGVWTKELIDSTAIVTDFDFEIGGQDSLNIIYYDTQNHHLIYGYTNGVNSEWTRDTIATDTFIYSKAKYINLELSHIGNAHMSYYDSEYGALEYMHYEPATMSMLLSETVARDTLRKVGLHNHLSLDLDSSPHITYTNSLAGDFYYSHMDGMGSWQHTMIDPDLLLEKGKPSKIQIDQEGNPWILYNYVSGFDRLRLIGRDSLGWYDVVIPSEGRIAKAFSFQILGESFIIAGKKNEFDNKGMALIMSTNGINIEREEELLITDNQLSIYPNPSNGLVNIRIETQLGQDINIEVFDLGGRRFASHSLQQTQASSLHSIDLSELSGGIYLVKTTVGSQTVFDKLIIRK